ncbi:MAG: glycosyltransferase [Thermoleophilia bacterium]
MSDVLSIAVVCPTPWPPGDDVAWAVRGQADALAARGHRVTLLVPGTDRALLAEGRRVLAGPAEGLRAPPGAVEVVCVGRAIRTGRAGHVTGPLDLAQGLETALRRGAFDVVHVHDPLAPSPGLTALRHTAAATVGTFHRPLVSSSFLGPLVQRAVDRLDLRLADSELVQRAVAQLLPGGSTVLRPGADPAPPVAGDGIAIIARGRERAGLRFALALARDTDAAITVIGPREAPWRTRAAVPKALRDRVTIVDDTGPESWHRLLAGAAIVLAATPGDVDDPVTRMALSGGRLVLAPEGPQAAEWLVDGETALVLPPFSRPAWRDALAAARADRARRDSIGHTAAARTPGHAATAAQLEDHYTRAMALRAARHSDPGVQVVADLRVRPTPEMDPAAFAQACVDAGLDVVAVAAPGDLEPARAVKAAAPRDLTVVVGQEVHTREGVLIGLVLSQPVPDGLDVADTARLIRGQGGVVVAPHPDTCIAPPAEVLRRNAALIDAYELVTATAGPAAPDVGRAAQRLGVVVSAATVTGAPESLGMVGLSMRAFIDGPGLVAALADATVIRPRRGRRARRARARAASRST